MLNILNSRIALSGATIVAAAAIVAGATFAFFSDSETSTGNVFQAGEIDLKIDNTSYALDSNIPGFQEPQGVLVANTANSWVLNDLTIQKFFDFTDLKPGDYGEDTISIHVNNNDAWLCAAARITSDLDNSFTEPEDEVDGPAVGDGTPDGDLDNALNFAFWKDDGDNILETDEVGSVFLSGPLNNIGAGGKIALADASGDGPYGSTPIPGGSTQYIGKAFCYGTFTATPVTQDGVNTSTPLAEAGTGFTCDGSGVGNIGQTDSATGDLQFYAVQSRNNTSFTCNADYAPVWPSVTPTATPVPTL
jgi:predicted ribosomally synthesized peptide with SipW-like signal peptide